MAFTEPLVIELEGRIESPGESVRVEGVLDVASYAVGEKEFTLDNGIAYDVMLTNAGDGILRPFRDCHLLPVVVWHACGAI